MNKLYIPEPVSGGLLLSYRCTSECKHCMYACSPRWKADWISEEHAEKILTQLADKIQGSPLGSDRIGINYGLHFTGGEPFLNFDLLLKVTEIAHEHKIPSTFVETNCFWCRDDESTRRKLTQLKDAGLHGILISVNPFILEYVPFERTERAVRISKEIFGEGATTYQEFFYYQFKKLNFKDTLSFKEYLQKAGPRSLSYVELLPMGRAPYKLGYLYKKYPAKKFFGESCREELTRDWHVHIDNYGNYMTGYCGGISLGDARNLELIHQIDLDERPIVDALVTDLEKLHDLGKQFGYKQRSEGYVSKCHLCVDIRKHIAQQTDEFEELNPREFYRHLE
ncbi:radical SAM protein [Candidatus Bathyarchaeota archaeon]|nr:radical SAM protein [Candidatus Bathyarchaeota archaeon]